MTLWGPTVLWFLLDLPNPPAGAWCKRYFLGRKGKVVQQDFDLYTLSISIRELELLYYSITHE